MWFRMPLAWCVAVLFLVSGSVGCGGDDDDDSADDDAADDDAADDDAGDDDADDDAADDDTGDDDAGVDIENLDVGTCSPEKAPPDPTVDPFDIVEIDWEGGVLTVHRFGAIVNCGMGSPENEDWEVTVEVDIDGQNLTVNEDYGGMLADCVCAVDLSYDIVGIPPGEYAFTHEGITESGAKAGLGGNIAALDLTLDDGEDWQWGVPLVDTITGNQLQGPIPTGDSFTFTVSPCFLEDKTSVQVSHRVGWTEASEDGVWMIVHDRRDLDTPGDRGDVCILFDYTIDEGLDAGEYTFFAPSFDFRESDEFYLYERSNPVVVE
ncbi:MAG: hypothetical protein IT350_11220 [Deltaproteobacteria bacterium]|nr:hypothetical protein [Deltaproteobacteria bacterium]